MQKGYVISSTFTNFFNTSTICMKSMILVRIKINKLWFVLFTFLFITSCASNQLSENPTPTNQPTNKNLPSASTKQSFASEFDLQKYAFPQTVDPRQSVIFYLHGLIVENQGIHAVSPDFGEYQYQAILEKFEKFGAFVISEKREKDTETTQYAYRVKDQITQLLNSGVPASHITIVGASKGAWITVEISNLLENNDLNYVLLSVCNPSALKYFTDQEVILHGNVLSIYDVADTEYAGSCNELFSRSAKKGLGKFDEVVLNIGTGHGIVYKPLDEWMIPAAQWAKSLNPDTFLSTSSSVLGPEQSLVPGQRMISPNSQFSFTLRNDGTLVLHYQQVPLWESETAGSGAEQLLLLADGNLILLDHNQKSLWESHTTGRGVSNLTLQDDGNLILTTLWSKEVTWSSGTPIETYIRRAKVWVDRGVTYDQAGTAHPDGTRASELSGYRTDCSGFVSMAWGLPDTGLRVPNTVRIISYTKLLESKDELVPGDAINNRQPGNHGHILLFVKWVDKDKGTFTAYEEQCGWDGQKCSIGKAVQTTRTLVWLDNISGWGIEEYSAYNPWYLERKK